MNKEFKKQMQSNIKYLLKHTSLLTKKDIANIKLYEESEFLFKGWAQYPLRDRHVNPLQKDLDEIVKKVMK